MKTFVIIGLSTFGATLARKLAELKQEVLVIDQDEEKVSEVKDEVNEAVVADATDKRVLEKFVKDLEDPVVILSLEGSSLEKNVMITFYLREMGIEKIYVRASEGDVGKVLRLVGASEIIYPEHDMAIRFAEGLVFPEVMEMLQLSPEFGILETVVPERYVGKSLKEARLRNEFGITVLAIRQTVPEEIIVNPSADYVLKGSDVLIVLGSIESIQKFKSA